jgi:hypothetical protein
MQSAWFRQVVAIRRTPPSTVASGRPSNRYRAVGQHAETQVAEPGVQESQLRTMVGAPSTSATQGALPMTYPDSDGVRVHD